MVIATNQWPMAARISLSLANVGFRVGVVSPPRSAIRKITGVDAHYDFHSWSASRSIVRAIKDWSPVLLICSDDRAVEELHQLYFYYRDSNNKSGQTLVDLIETSLGAPTSFEIARDKSKFLSFAHSVGVRCPKTTVLPLDHFPERELAAGSFPAILKMDRSFGGRGVRIAYDKHNARSAFWELQFPPSHSSTLKRLYARVIATLPSRWVPLPGRTVSLQQRIIGRPSNRALVCLEGTVLAGISVEAIETLSLFGPATVVRVIDNPEMTATAETLVKHLNLSGFVGFDFILDAAEQAWVIEMNPRVTPTSHLCAGEVDLSAALWKRLTGRVPELAASPNKHELVALFPQELKRSPHSPHLAKAYHDVPRDQPEFVQVCLRSALRSHSFERGLDRLRIALAPRLNKASGDELHSAPPPVSTTTSNIDNGATDMIDLSIIIISFNTRDMTLECLRSIRAETKDVSFEIIVVDNNSKDDSAAAIETEFPEIRLMALKENIGFARANIFAVKEARGRKVLLLNPDTVVLDRAIDRLVAFADEAPSCRIWGGRTLNKDRSLNPSSCWRRMTLWSLACHAFSLSHFFPHSALFNPEAYGGWDRSSVRNVDIVSGCFFLIDRDLWDELDGFDPAFFMYGEEADLCLRARQLGARPTVTPSATIVHYGGASTISTLEQRLLLLKGKATLMNQHWQPISRRLGRVLFLLSALIRWGSYRLASLLIGRPGLSSAAAEWRAVWQRREEWINGYAPLHEQS
jgi:GT2 family glycosyltransferase